MQYTNEELQTILDLHEKWLYNSKEGKCADLRDADLRNADLRRIVFDYGPLRRQIDHCRSDPRQLA